MKKKVYVQPSVSVYEMEAESIMAESVQVQAEMEDDSSLEYGGNTQEGSEYKYNPW